jgi:coproporphyrinogen III oxidase
MLTLRPLSSQSPSPFAQTFITFITQAQTQITQALNTIDPTPFHTDTWTRPGGGGGQTMVLANGPHIAKGGANISAVQGKVSPKESPLFKQMLASQNISSVDPTDAHFVGCGISIVIHPRNPHAPTCHANYRYFELQTTDQSIWWFGGGADLTPYILYEEDAQHFHQILKTACDEHASTHYAEYKAWCDRYFYIPHRNEHRGIGGLFFDYLKDTQPDTLFPFIQSCTNAFIPAYKPLLEKRIHTPTKSEDHHWHQLRRGRYAEFNLVYDKGTLFGLKTNGRIESILMSLPPEVKWDYDSPTPLEHAELIQILKEPKDWIV